jgi:hypothetical protein
VIDRRRSLKNIEAHDWLHEEVSCYDYDWQVLNQTERHLFLELNCEENESRDKAAI